MNVKCNLLTVLLFYCLLGSVNAQDVNWQDLVNRKQYAAVVAHADSLTAADSTSYTTMNAVGQAFEGMLRYREAYASYHQCLSLDTASVDMLNALARTATNLGKAKDAEVYFHRVLASDSLNFYANYQLARLYYQLGDYTKAIGKYEKLQEQNPDNSTLWSNIGDCYSRLELYPGASLAYFQAYNRNRENAGLANVLINTMYRLGGDYALEGLAICDTALRYNPDNRLLLRTKAMGLYMSKNFSLADSIYSVLVADGDSTYLTLKYGGASKYYAALYLPSIDLLEMAYEQDSTSVEVCLLLGSALGKTYDRKRANALLDKAEKGLKPSPFLWNQLLVFRAETYWKEGRKKESAALYYQVWKDNPTRVDLLGEIARMYSEIDASKYPSQEERQRGLFIQTLYMNEMLKKGADVKVLVFTRALLQSFYEDLFFRNLSEETLIAPDGKRSTISVVDLRGLINMLPEESEQVLEIRAGAAKNDRKYDEAARLYYQAWKVRGTRVELAREIAYSYNHPDISYFKSPEDLQRGVFAQVFYVRELLKNGLPLTNLDSTHLLLQSLCDDMSRRGRTEQPLLAPDGQKSALSMTELRNLIGQLPEVSAGTIEMIEMMIKERKKNNR